MTTSTSVAIEGNGDGGSPVNEFKARCLALFGRAAKFRAVRNHKRPVARVAPGALDRSIRVLVDDDRWFSTGDLVVIPGEPAGKEPGR